ncbi:UNVERIFIED_CONTAM: hypothetical protein HDU68_007947 [Siphonaria sp. JEL0065]|nr:hypothetical protein HDU68_007947 [Siphonaria sp. JEL0065]
MSHISEHVELGDKMEAHRLRREEKDKIHAKVLVEGAKMGIVTSAGAVAASFAAHRFIPAYRRLTLPFRISLVLAATTAGFFTETDRAAMRADREFSQKFSITNVNELEHISTKPTIFGESSDWDLERVKQVAFKNRFTLLAYSYFGIVGTTLVYNFSRTDIFMTQKFVNARLVGQFSAVAGILLIGAAAVGNKPEQKIDPYYERIVNGDKQPENSK